MITAQEVKRHAKALGADMVGIGNIERWAGAPLQMDPRQIMPEARSIIAVGFRVMRGSLRGIEEGTMFSNYSAMGYGGITYLFMPMVVMNLSRRIEDAGFEAFPMGHQSDWRAIDNEGQPKGDYSRPVAPGRAAPDVMVHLRIAAYLCGLGEIGYSKMFLSPQFGPRQRVGIILTDAELEPDPIYSGPPLCNGCKACVHACPGQAIPGDRTVKANVNGKELEWADIDCSACDIAFRGAVPAAPGEEVKPEDVYSGALHDPFGGKTHAEPTKRGSWTPFVKKPNNVYNSGQAVCGGRGCVRACMISMEARGVMQNKFHQKFRRRKPWSIDWSMPYNREGVAPRSGEAD